MSTLDLPPVCETGDMCRADHLDFAIENMKVEWNEALTMIDHIFEQTVEQVKQVLVTGYEEAYECDPGCTCTNIEIEFEDII